jgi:hypothetical protein
MICKEEGTITLWAFQVLLFIAIDEFTDQHSATVALIIFREIWFVQRCIY